MIEKKQKFLHNRKGNGMVEVVSYSETGKRSYKSTGIRVDPCDWDYVNQVAIGDNADLINTRLDMFLIENRIKLDRQDIKRINLIEWLYDQIEESGHKPGYIRQQMSMVEALRRYGKIKYLTDVNYIALARWDTWLRRDDPDIKPQKPRSDITIHNNYHKNLRAYLQQAVYLGLLKENPYNRFKYSHGKSEERTPLTRVQYYAVLEYNAPVPMQRSYDLFVFQLLTGMSYADAQNFDFKGMNNGWYTAQRVKNGMRFHTVIPPRAQTILNKWRGVPIICLEPYNRALKTLADNLGIKIKLSSHIARHTFITHALEEGISPNVVQRMVGHSSLVMTERYTHLSTDYIEDGAAALLR